MVVVKYFRLHCRQYVRLQPQSMAWRSSPVDLAVVLSARRILFAELHAGKRSLLPAHDADEAHDAVHAAGHIDLVAHADVAPVCAHSVCGRGGAADEGVERCFALECCAGGKGEVRRRFGGLERRTNA
jgi:hypothetical protein